DRGRAELAPRQPTDHRVPIVSSPTAVLTSRLFGVHGSWPEPPEFWSYSSLYEAEVCPRRWSLKRASYEGIWSRSGYPPRPSMPAIVGDVVHRALDAILRALYDAGCASV